MIIESNETFKDLPESVVGLVRYITEDVIPYNKELGIKLEEAQVGRAVLRIPFDERLIGDPRRPAIHGGVTAVLIDAAGGTAVMTTLSSANDRVSTIDMRVDYIRPAAPQDLIATATVIRSGHRIAVTKIRITQPDTQDLIAEGTAVYNLKRHPTDSKSIGFHSPEN
jgi:uncharacterized protein (TIGR00369 family)